MSLLPDQASFQELVQDCFLTYRGCGLAVSALDVDLVQQWASRGIPFEVVARGIRRGAERALWDATPGEPPFRSLRACKRQVDEEIRRYLRLSAGRGSEDLENQKRPRGQDRMGRFRSSLRRLRRAKPHLQPCVQRLLDGPLLRPGAHSDRAAQESVALQLVRALPFEERTSLLKEAAGLMSAGFATSAEERRRGRRFVVGALVRKALQLPSFW